MTPIEKAQAKYNEAWGQFADAVEKMASAVSQRAEAVKANNADRVATLDGLVIPGWFIRLEDAMKAVKRTSAAVEKVMRTQKHAQAV